MSALWLITHQFSEQGRRRGESTHHQSGPGSTPFVAKLKEEIYNDACRVYERSLRICEKAAMIVSFKRFYDRWEVPNCVMLTSTNRNKVSLIKVLNHYFCISLVDVKNEKDHILHSRAVRASRAPGIPFPFLFKCLTRRLPILLHL